MILAATNTSRWIWGHIPDLAIFVYEYLEENSRWIWKIFFGARAWPADGMVMHVMHRVEVNEYGGKWEVCNAYSQFMAPRDVSDCCLRH